MKPIAILDTTSCDTQSSFRGGGRIMQLLKENLSDKADFISSLHDVAKTQVLLLPGWSPYTRMPQIKNVGKRHFVMMFDMIPLKYPTHFPAGLKGQLNFLYNRFSFSDIDEVITISEVAKDDIASYLGFNPKKINVVYPTLSKSFLRSPQSTTHNPQLTTHNQYCLYVGDVNWNKNLINIARAVKIAQTTCVFVGKPFKKHNNKEETLEVLESPWLSEFRGFLKEVWDDKRFIFKEYIPDGELAVLYKHALCNILVSRDEGFGLSYLEAASQGCPSVLADTSIFHEIAGDTALFAPAEDPNAIAKTIQCFMHDPKRARDYGQKAKKHVMHYDPSHFRTNLLKILLKK